MSVTSCHSGMRPFFSFPVSHKQRQPRRTAPKCTASSEDSAQKYRWKLDAKPNPHKRGRSNCFLVQAPPPSVTFARSPICIYAYMYANMTNCLTLSHSHCGNAGDLKDLPLSAIRRPLGRTRSNGKHFEP